MATLSQLLRRAIPFWSKNTSSSAMMVMVPMKMIPWSHRSYVFVISASASAMGILSHVAATGLSNEKCDVCAKNMTSNKFIATSSSGHSNKSVWSTSLLQSLRNYQTHHNRLVTYCESATTANSSNNSASSSFTTSPSVKRFDTNNGKDTAPPSEANSDGTARTATVLATTTATMNPTIKSNIQRQV